jgi:hypothetical protein
MMFGKNSNTELILAMIGLKECDIERFRDCGVDEEKIYIYTRTGGGNRDDYPNEILTSNEYYIEDEDDDFDSTYATYYFYIPPEIKQDFLDFTDSENKGISAKFIQWINKTLNRSETKSDLYAKNYARQMQVIKEQRLSNGVSEAFNGHSMMPLSDRGMEAMLNVIEGNDGKFIAYWNFLPYKFKIMQNEAKWSFDKNKSDLDQEKIRIGIDIIWEIDDEAWNRYWKKFSKKYPKSMNKMKESVEEMKNKVT